MKIGVVVGQVLGSEEIEQDSRTTFIRQNEPEYGF